MRHDQRLETWKEIAAYLGVGVRTAQRYLKESQLPVHRMTDSERSRVFAYADELEAWRDDDRLAVQKQDRWRWLRDLPRRYMVLGVVTVLLAGVFVVSRVESGRSRFDALSCTIRDNRLIARDAAGDWMWEYAFDQTILASDPAGGHDYLAESGAKRFAQVDLDGDGAREILLVTQNRPPQALGKAVLHCLDREGQEQWRYAPGQRMTFGDTTWNDVWSIDFFTVGDVDRDGQKEILVCAFQPESYPASATLLSPTGKVLGRFVNSGHISNIRVGDLDRDGENEVLVAGFNNGYHKGCLAVLDPRHMTGSSPQPDTPAYRCPDLSVAPLRHYLLIPADPVNKAVMGMVNIGYIRISEKSVILSTEGCRSSIPPAWGGTVMFHFNRRWELTGIQTDMGYRVMYRYYRERGLVPAPYDPGFVHELAPVLDWNGEAFVPVKKAEAAGQK